MEAIKFLREKYKITPPDQSMYDAVKANWDGVAKPLDGLGWFEHVISQIGAIEDSTNVCISKRAVIVMCADNGIVREGISQSGQEVTLAVAQSMGRRESSVCRMASASHTDVIPVDIGIAASCKIDGVLASETAGRGAGLNDKGLSRKKQVIQEAIDRYDLYKADAFTVLQTVGGFDIAGLTGVFIGGAMYHVPIVLDGLISGAAALLAKRIIPGTEHFMIASHLGKEPAAKAILKEIGIKPVIHGDLALGEGTGAVMVFSLLDLAMSVYNGRTDFSRLEMAPYERLS